ncbi:MFS transporter [Desulfosarcina sp. OttesenSCG-928-A07]|nr:MFS transporter [Desulfosarcina sp. OttesenSCG-928-A07]
MNRASRKIFGTLFFSIFTVVTGTGIVVPMLPVYAHSLGASGLYIGMIFGAFSLSRTFCLPLFGTLSDQKGRKPFIVAGLFFYAVISAAFILSTTVSSLITVRFAHGIASAMVMPVVQAYVGDITPKGREGWVMGLFNMSMMTGLSAGPVLGGVIMHSFGLQTTFVCMGVMSLLAFGMSLVFLPPTAEEQVMTKDRRAVKWSVLLTDRPLLGLFLFRVGYTGCIGIIWGFLPIFGDVTFSLSSLAIGLLVTLMTFVSGLIQVPMGWTADRYSRKVMVVLGGSVVTLSVFLFSQATGFQSLLMASILFGVGGGISMPALMAGAVLRGKQKSAMGPVMALLTLGHSLGMMAGSILAGVIVDLFEIRHAFMLGSFSMVMGVVGFVWLTRGENLASRQAP